MPIYFKSHFWIEMLSTFIISGNNRGDDETDRQSVSGIQTTNDES